MHQFIAREGPVMIITAPFDKVPRYDRHMFPITLILKLVLSTPQSSSMIENPFDMIFD